MGTFGINPLEDDTALDWLIQIGKRAADSVVRALDAVSTNKRLIGDKKAAEALAAIELIRCSIVPKRRKKYERLFEVSGISIESLKETLSPTLINKAIHALEEIRKKSEIAAIWERDGQGKKWQKMIDGIKSDLLAYIETIAAEQ